MTFDARYFSAFRDSAAALERAAANLTFTLGRVASFPPLTPDAVTALPPQARERLDALAARFARCRQTAGNAFKALALLEADPQPRFIDLLALIQKRGLIDSIENWDMQRDLRNDVGNVYFATDAEFADFYNTLAEAAPGVAAYWDRLRTYAQSLGIRFD
ncbi:MAG: hypothetical protein M0006_12915 [Magnetospirillum sp.]|nr:hypothetical protein [Magnetospirillum sp.]